MKGLTKYRNGLSQNEEAIPHYGINTDGFLGALEFNSKKTRGMVVFLTKFYTRKLPKSQASVVFDCLIAKIDTYLRLAAF